MSLKSSIERLEKIRHQNDRIEFTCYVPADAEYDNPDCFIVTQGGKEVERINAEEVRRRIEAAKAAGIRVYTISPPDNEEFDEEEDE